MTSHTCFHRVAALTTPCFRLHQQQKERLQCFFFPAIILVRFDKVLLFDATRVHFCCSEERTRFFPSSFFQLSLPLLLIFCCEAQTNRKQAFLPPHYHH